ncbi:MAG: helix-turn-helix domain-containing protein [Saprospiraceae bacterium]
MKAKIIKTKEDYDKACERIYFLIHSTYKLIAPNSEKGEELELLSCLVEIYERENFPLKTTSPIEAIRFRLDQMNLTQSDIAPLFGSKSRVSEVLHGKRPLTLRMIQLLNQFLGIPFEILLNGNTSLKLEAIKERTLLKSEAIKNYYSNKQRR